MITSRILIGCAPWVARLAGWHDWLRGSFHLVLYNTHLAPLGMSLPAPSSPRGAPGLGITALWRPPPSSFSSPLPCFRSFASEGPFLSRPPNAPYTTHCRGWPLVPPYPATLLLPAVGGTGGVIFHFVLHNTHCCFGRLWTLDS